MFLCCLYLLLYLIILESILNRLIVRLISYNMAIQIYIYYYLYFILVVMLSFFLFFVLLQDLCLPCIYYLLAQAKYSSQRTGCQGRQATAVLILTLLFGIVQPVYASVQVLTYYTANVVYLLYNQVYSIYIVAPVGTTTKPLLLVILYQYLRDGILAVSPYLPRFLAIVYQPLRYAYIYNSIDAAIVKADIEYGYCRYNIAIGSIQLTLDCYCLFLVCLLSCYIGIPDLLCIELGLLDCGPVNNISGIYIKALASFPNLPSYIAYPIVKYLQYPVGNNSSFFIFSSSRLILDLDQVVYVWPICRLVYD